MKPSLYIYIAILVSVFSPHATADDECVQWFKNSGLSKDAKDCVINCDILPKDMGTFMCSERCEEFCKPQKCKDDSYWAGKIKVGRPANWKITSEATSDWTPSEKKKLMEMLNRFPDRLKSVPFEGFYRMKKSVTLTNPATTANRSANPIAIK